MSGKKSGSQKERMLRAFHILGREGAAQVRIDTLEIIQMSGKLDLREALIWAEQNRTFLEMKWTEFSGE
jgi:hypothetical protein